MKVFAMGFGSTHRIPLRVPLKGSIGILERYRVSGLLGGSGVVIRVPLRVPLKGSIGIL